MKKLLACLLCLMLPCCALADPIGMDMSWTISQEGLIELLYALSEGITAGVRYPLVEEWIGAFTAFMSGFAVNAVSDLDIGRCNLSVTYQGEEIHTYDAAVTDNGVTMRHSWLPDSAILISASGLTTESQSRTSEALRTLDWNAVYGVLDTCFRQWAGAMEATEEIGHFTGDAYTGGTRRVTMCFDEHDLSRLLDMLLDADWPEEFTTLLRYPILAVGKDPDEAHDYLRTRTRLAEHDDRYRYMACIVSDEPDLPIGLSLTIYQEEKQVATLSVGTSPNSLDTTVVLGYGLRNENCYLVMRSFKQNEDSCFLSTMLLRDPTRQQTFKAVAEDPANVLMYVKVFDRSDGNAIALEISASGLALWNTEIDVLFSRTQADACIAYELTARVNQQPLVSASLACRPADALPPLDISGLRIIDLNDLSKDDLFAMADATKRSINEFVVMMFRKLPPELIVLPMNDNFFSPE